MQRFIIKHEDGDGEAVKAMRGGEWEVNVPEGSFRWFGTVAEVRAEIKNRCPGVTGFGPTEESESIPGLVELGLCIRDEPWMKVPACTPPTLVEPRTLKDMGEPDEEEE